MSLENWQKEDRQYIAGTYDRFHVALVGGEGATLYGEDGKKYVDFGSGIAVNVFGVNDAAWKEAVTAQLGCIQHASNLYYTTPQIGLAKLLCGRTGADKVFFSNSGAEANECAIKAARKYSFDKYGGGRFRIVTLQNSFHGRTMATLSATGQDAMHRYFMPFLEGFDYAAPTYEGVRAKCGGQTCAVMLELVQGEGGVRALDKDDVKKIAAFCREHDILLVVDEVQTGNGRTGTLYAYEQYGIEPDIVTTAKGLGGGLPLGATMLFGRCGSVFSAGDHGSTFGGNPVACAGAVSILSRITKELLLEVQGKSAYLRTHLGRIRGVNEVSGLGLMIGLTVEKDARAVAEACLARGLLVLTAKSKVRLLPPLTIRKDEMDLGLNILNEVLAQ